MRKNFKKLKEFKKNHLREKIRRACCSYNNFFRTSRETRKSRFVSCLSHSPRHPYHRDKGDQRNQWEKDDQKKIPPPNFCDMYSHVKFGLSESKGGTRHLNTVS